MADDESLRALVVEDDAEARENVCDILALDGHAPEVATSLHDAFGERDLGAVDVIILDRRLGDGYADDWLDRVRRDAPHASLIIITGYEDVSGAVTAIRRGASDYILKPIDPELLRNRLARTAESRRLAREKSEVEAALRCERDLAENIIETSPVIILVLDLEGRIIRFNAYTEQLTGIRLEEVRGEAWIDCFLPERERDRIRTILEQSRTGADTSGTANPIRTRDGAERRIVWSNRRLTDERGEPHGILAIGHDVTELDRARTQEAQLAAIVRDSSDAILSTAPDGTITSWNEAAERTYGYPAAEAVGQPVAMLVPAERLAEWRRLRDRVAAGERVGHVETIRVRKDGTRIPVSMALSPIREAQGEIGAISAIGRDLSERRALEKQILEASTEEQRRIGQDLHDGLGQDLTGIKYLLSSLRHRLENRDAPETEAARTCEHQLEEAIRHARALVRGLRPLHLEEGRIRDALDELADHIRQTHGTECVIRGNKQQLDDPRAAVQLFYIAREAAHNALRHGNASRLEIVLHEEAGELELAVTDDGAGLPAEAQRARGSGLSIMTYRANLIGATFDAAARPEGGTRVRCRLRAPAPASAEAGA